MRALATVPTWLIAEPAWAGAQLAGGSSPDIPWLRLVLSFAVCLLVAVGAIVALKRFQGTTRGNRFAGMLGRDARRAGPAIRLLETRRIGLHADLCLVEFEDQQMLLAATAHGVEILDKRGISRSTEVGGAG